MVGYNGIPFKIVKVFNISFFTYSLVFLLYVCLLNDIKRLHID